MTAERWSEVKRIVNACLDLPAEQRAGHVAALCSGDPFLIEEVNSMLASHAELGDFMEPSGLLDEPDDAPAGGWVGHYHLCERIGEGGMGVVYRAVRASDYEKQVAIKIVKRGMDTDFVLWRFRQERQILAGLDHPYIARLIDGGATAEGQPYLVMEYVEGCPITEYCEQNNLKLSERLQLFRMICAAVQFAHQSLVVHRDLKPANMLVTAAGVPKLLDFGIAKLLEPDAGSTITSMRLMTPECASPEQLRGEPVTTATDIYSLGILLYQLLTGEPPFQFTTRSPQELQRLICETEPRKPGAVRAVPDDLETIVLRAMHKEPARRYASAEQLSEDLGRYLNGMPVMARKDTLGYRASKFLGRHKAGSAAAVLFACSLIAGMGATLAEMHVARTERARAERRFNDVRRLADTLIFEVHDGVQKLPGSTSLRKLIVDRAVTYLDSLSQEVGSDNGLRRELARAYFRLGQVQGGRGTSNLGATQAASVSFRKAVKFYEEILNSGQASVQDRRALADTCEKLSIALWDSGDKKEAESLDLRALRIRQDLASRLSTVELSKELGSSYITMGVHRVETDLPATEENYRKAVDAYERVLRAEPNSSGNMQSLSLAEKHLGGALILQHRYEEALNYYRAAQAIDKRRIAADPNNAEARMDITYAYSDIGYILRAQGDLRGALASYRKVEGLRAAMVATDPKDERAQSGLASSHFKVGEILWRLHRTEQATASFEKARQIRESLLTLDPASSSAEAFLAATCAYLGGAYAELARSAKEPEPRLALWRKALPHYQRAAQMIAALKASGPLTGDAAEASQRVDRELPQCLAAIAELTPPGA